MAGVSGKLIAGGIVLTGLIAGIAMYYLQVYAFYEPVPADSPAAEVRLTSVVSGQPEPVGVAGFDGIDADSSPVRFRACFTVDRPLDALTAAYARHDDPVPLVAPGWFDCFDARAIGAALEQGEAVAFMGQENIRYGIDRVIAVFPDGRGYAWNQINHCGAVVFEGKPAPEGCPPPPETK
ncbi:DUF6446 family protein [Actibacterium sp. MT2.3-13A]|uniref:DUF6446 family protein n=1 Tax=Actibacterium sp. MT2.3-13A TaxID=2828332 RepID=UPI001BA66704|nr:DUF6446 family protein [Actibacterium sp. MT2.3-13A]